MSDFEDWLKKKEDRKNGVKPPKKVYQMKRSKLNPVSKKQKKKNALISKSYKEHYADEENRKCALCGSRENLSVHHRSKRLGDKAHDPNTFITLCLTGSYLADLHPELNRAEGCHGMVEANKSWARQNNYLD